MVFSGKTGHMSNSMDSSGCFAGVHGPSGKGDTLNGTLAEVQMSH